MEIAPNDKAKNFAKVRELASKIRKSADDSVPGLIILPEMFATGYLPLHPESAAEHFFKNDAGETADFLYKLANETGCAIMGAGIEKSSESGESRDIGESRNLLNHSSVYIPRSAQEYAHYDKRHPFFMEQKKFSAGDKVSLFKIKDWNIAATICFDLRFPELYRDAVKAGARLITVQAAWPAARIAHWKTLLQARAIENQVYIAAVNGIGCPSYGGNSMIINPKGEIIASTDASFEGIVHARIDSKSQEEYRKQFPVLKGIVPEEYI
ncbi:nitrilase-related carbon-nitrogen hydrolase [Fibrobacter sp.]|uniref:nitrilase-related carbon-nitrogen hydrolase n=1 Tax=Fibrobacter sp. TaxID=35828 RepID=UPI00260E0B83|nr:nitrilase-related carbon-nitrogen hydrolase [Fibrobacter sp.]